MINVPWHFAFLDKKTTLIALAILVLPLAVLINLWSTDDKQKKLKFSESTVSDLIYDIEIMLDHLNGALINLNANFTNCSSSINQMYRYAFDLSGVEGFMIVDEKKRLLCSNWHPNQTIEVDLPRSFTLGLSKEYFLNSVGKNGFFAYRTGADNNTYVAVLSSSYLRYLLNQKTIAITDSLALVDLNQDNPLSISGLLSNVVLQNAVAQFTTTEKSETIKVNEFNVTIERSDQHPNIAVAYLYRDPSMLQTALTHRTEIALTIIGQLFALIIWLTHRFKLLNSMKIQLSIALDKQEFVPYLQPIIDIQTGRWVGVEVLARWQRNGQDVAYPNEFIPIAEKYGLIKKLTKQIANQTFSFYSQNVESLTDFFISINLSPNHIDEKTIESVRQIRERYPDIKTSQIKLEITEQGLGAEKAQETKGYIEQLRLMGCQVGLDDFGTGQSGLEYFTHLTFDFIKIDQRFVDAIGKNNVDSHLLKTIIQLAASLKLDVIAEGVENEQQAAWLAAHDVRFAQGWLYAKAMSLAEFKAMLKKQTVD